MPGSNQLRDAIKRQLKARNLRYAELAKALDLSEASIKRLLSRGGITLERLDEICEFLGIDLYELVRSGRQDDAGKQRELSLAQERALAADDRLLLAFHLLRSDWPSERIRTEFDLSEPDMVLLLARLDRLKLIELLPKNRTRLLVARDFAWRSDGPVLKRHARSAMVEFLRGGFDGADAFLRLDIKELSPASLAQLKKRLQRLGDEFAEMAELDAGVPADARRGVGLVLAMRPWTFSLIDALRASPVGAADAGAGKPASRRKR